jgi:hypothetical protein
MLGKGDLIFYEPSGEAHKLIELEADAELSALTLYPDALLVSDSQKVQLILVSHSDFSTTQLDQDSLQEVLSAISQQRSHWLNVYYIGLALLISFICMGLIAGYLDWQARKVLQKQLQPERPILIDGELIIPDEIRTRISPDANGVYWLSLTPESLRIFKAITLLIPAALFWIFYATFSNTDFELNSPLLLSLVMIISLFAMAMWFLHYALPRLRIGTDGRALYLVDYFGKQATATPDSCIRTRNRLLIGKLTAPIKQQGPILFDKELFGFLIEPMLAQVPKTNEFSLMWQNLRNGDPTTWLGVVAIALLLMKDLWF